MKVSVLSLVFLPLTFGYAIFRYRLMDVDLIFKRGMAYTLAAAFDRGCVFRAGRRGLGDRPQERIPAPGRGAGDRDRRLPRCCSIRSRTGFRN